MILIKEVNFKKKLELLSLDNPVDLSDHMFQNFYNTIEGNIYYPFFMRYPITDQNFFEAVD